MTPLEISPREADELRRGVTVVFIDVREPWEFSLARIEGAELMPMSYLAPERLRTLAAGGLLVVYCHHGVRSLKAVSALRGQSIEQCRSMAGGIDRWSVEVDASIPRY